MSIEGFCPTCRPHWTHSLFHYTQLGCRACKLHWTHSSFPPQLGQSNLIQNLRNEKKGREKKKKKNWKPCKWRAWQRQHLTHQLPCSKISYQASVTHSSYIGDVQFFPLWFLTPAGTVPHASHIGHIQCSICSFPPELNQSNLTQNPRKNQKKKLNGDSLISLSSLPEQAPQRR